MLQKTLNRILNFNPHYLVYLQEIAGISLALELSDLPLKMTLIAHESFIEVGSGMGEFGLCLKGSALDFIAFATQKDQRQKLLQTGKISFTGDLMILQRLVGFLDHYNIPRFLVRPYLQMKKFSRNQREYWQEEAQILASPILWDYFKDALLELQQEFDRLALRVQGLEACE